MVVDASIALAWCFEDEQSDAARAVLDQIEVDGAVVPAIWPFEVSNGLRNAVRRGRLSSETVVQARRLLFGVPIAIWPIDLTLALGVVADLAEQYNLTVYDAAYLELAQREGVPLATLDRRLREVAAEVGVALV